MVPMREVLVKGQSISFCWYLLKHRGHYWVLLKNHFYEQFLDNCSLLHLAWNYYSCLADLKSENNLSYRFQDCIILVCHYLKLLAWKHVKSIKDGLLFGSRIDSRVTFCYSKLEHCFAHIKRRTNERRSKPFFRFEVYIVSGSKFKV